MPPALLPFLRRTVLALWTIGALGWLTGCGPRTTRVDQGNATGVLQQAIDAEPQTLDPHLAVALSDLQIISGLGEGLTAIDEATSHPIPAAAAGWEVSPDRLTWTFHLRPGLTWSDGTPLVALTFRDSWVRALSPTLASEYAYALFPIRNAARFNAGDFPDAVALGVKVVDDLTLRVTLEHPDPTLPAVLALPIAFPVPLHVLRQVGGTLDRNNPWARPGTHVSNGPLQLVEWLPNQHLKTERNPRFRGAATMKLQGVVFYPFENLTSQENAFRAGQLHLTSGLPLTKIAAYRRDQPDRLRLDPALQTLFLRFNTTRPPLDDPRVRRALALAIDRTALTDHVLTGGEQPAFRLTPPGIQGYTAAPGVGFDPDQARTLLAAAGFPGGRGLRSLQIISRPREIDQKLLEAAQQMWKRELGVEVTLTLEEQRVWLDDQSNLNYDLSSGAWIGDFVDPYTFLALFLSDSGNNNTGWKAPRYDELLGAALTAPDEPTRFAHYAAAEALLLAEAPITPLVHGTQAYLIRPEVKGWSPALLGIHRYDEVRLEP